MIEKIRKREEGDAEVGPWNKIRIRVEVKIWRREKEVGIMRERRIGIESGVYTHIISKAGRRKYIRKVIQWSRVREYKKTK